MSSDGITPNELRELANLIERNDLEVPEATLAINGASGKTDATLTIAVDHGTHLEFKEGVFSLG